MIDFVLADSPTAPPYKCYVCGNARGKMIDTNMFDDLDRRIYLCKTRCMKRGCQLLGWISGEEMERLERAAADLEQAGVEIQTREDRLNRQDQKIALMQREIESLRALHEADQGRIKAAEHLLQVNVDHANELKTVLTG